MSTGARVIRNTFALSIGQAVTLALGAVFTALLARHIGPEGYGRYALAQSTVAILMVFVGLGFSPLIIRNVAQSRESASKYFTNIVFVRAVLAILVFALFLLFAIVANDLSELSLLVILLGASMTLEALTQVAGDVFYAFERMGYDAFLQAVRAALALGLGTVGILLGGTLVQIVALLIVANLIKAILAFGLLVRRIARPRFEIDLRFCRNAIRATLPFAMMVIVSAIFANVSVIMLGNYRDERMVGWYASAIRVLNILLFVPGIFWISIYPVFARHYSSSSESLRASYRKSYEWGLKVGLPMAAGTALVADQVIRLLFGPGFEDASRALRILSWVIAFGFCNNINGAALTAMGREKLLATLATATVAVVVFLNWILIPRFGHLGPAITYVAATGLGFLVYSHLCHRWLKLALPWKQALGIICAILPMMLVVRLALELQINFFAIVLLIGPLSYGGILYLLKGISLEDIGLLKRVAGLAEAVK